MADLALLLVGEGDTDEAECEFAHVSCETPR